MTDGLRSPTQSSRTNQDNLRQRSNTLARHGAATEATSGVHAATVGSTQRPATRQSRTRSSNAHTGRSRGRGVGEGVTIIDIESMSKYSEDYMSSSGDLDVVVACPELQVPIIEEAVNRVSYTKRTQVKLVASAVAEGWTAASRMGAGVSHNGGGYYAEEGEQTVHGYDACNTVCDQGLDQFIRISVLLSNLHYRTCTYALQACMDYPYSLHCM